MLVQIINFKPKIAFLAKLFIYFSASIRSSVIKNVLFVFLDVIETLNLPDRVVKESIPNLTFGLVLIRCTTEELTGGCLVKKSLKICSACTFE